MKNYKVVAIKFFKDSTEIDEKTGLKIERKVNDEFYCTKERYEYLKANNAVKLIEIVEEEKTIEERIEDIRNMDIGEPIPKQEFEKLKKEFELKPKKKKSSKK